MMINSILRSHRNTAKSIIHHLSTLSNSYETILVSREDGDTASKEKVGLGVGIITLNQPKKLNALSDAVFNDLIHAAKAFENMDDIGSIIITGKGKAFAAGADIEEMSTKDFASVYKSNMFSKWAEICLVSKPTIAAVNGYALGGGCELAMMCDIILAGEKAKFGQPEITLGVIPGMGGTQRLTRAVGKSRAMEIVLTGDFFGAEEAVKMGLASRVVQQDVLVDEAIALGEKIGKFSKPVAAMAKECVNQAHESSLKDGLLFERRLFHSCFALEDQKEGMSAFQEKRTPEWKHQ